MPRLEFPSGEEPIGKLEISGLATDEQIPAVGIVEVPEGASVRLSVERHSDLGALRLLGPDALTILRLDHPNFGDDDLSALSHLTGLQRLMLVNTAVTDAGMTHVLKLTGLVRLFLDGTGIGDEAVAALEDSQLQRLSVNNTKIGDGAMRAASRIGTLTHLMCANTRVTDAGLKYLKDMTQLALLDVSESEVTGEGLVHLPTNLALLVMCEGPKVADEQLARARTARPDLILNGVRHWTPPPSVVR